MARRKKEDQKMVSSTGRVFYCNNADMLKELKIYKETGGTITEELGMMFMDIARGLLNKSYFRNYSPEMKQDLMGQALLKMCAGIGHFDFKYKNPFAYVTQIAFNAYRAGCIQHYKQENIKKDLRKGMSINIDGSNCINANSTLKHQLEDYY